jgi:hypothetical protein
MYAAPIHTGELRQGDLPNSWGEWGDYARFALTFAPRDREECQEFASDCFAHWRHTGQLPQTLDQLRACLWFEQRRWGFLGRDPDPEGMRYAADLVRAMRALL